MSATSDRTAPRGPGDFTFRHSTFEVRFGPGRTRDLAGLVQRLPRGAAVAVVIDGGLVGTDVAVRIGLVLPDAAWHAVPIREPDTDSVEDCRAALAAIDPAMVVAVGGGSTMDTAKVARLLLANPGSVADHAGFDRPAADHPSLMVCVPTTAGTASEVSEMAVIGEAGSDVKLRFRNTALTARIALLDPELLLGLPRAVTANTGFDALTHALEAYVSRDANLMTDPFALDALGRIAQWLPVAFDSPDNVDARGHCLIGSMLAGIAFNTTMLGLAHAIAAPLGALHHLPHGYANALALPAVTAFNQPAFAKKADRVANALDAATPAQGIARLRAELGLDVGLDQHVPDHAGRIAIARAALKSGNIRTNPRPVSEADALAVIEAMRSPTGSAAPVLPA